MRSTIMTWVVAILAGLGLVLLYRACGDDGRGDAPILPPAVDSAYQEDVASRERLDSMTTAWVHEADSLRQEVQRRERDLRALKLAEQAARADAADAAEAARVAGDTLGKAWNAYLREHERAETLHVALTMSERIREANDTTILRLRLAFDTADARRARLEALADNLRSAVDEAAQRGRCRIAGLVPCPTRRQSVLLGVVAGTAAGLYLGGVGR